GVPVPSSLMEAPRAFVVTLMPEIEPADTEPELVPMVALLITPVPATPAASVAWRKPPGARLVMLAPIMEPLLAISWPDRVPIVTAERLVALMVLLAVTAPVIESCCKAPGPLTLRLPVKLPLTFMVAFC